MVARIRCRSSNVFLLDRQTADPTINGKMFGLAKTAMLFADHALRSLKVFCCTKIMSGGGGERAGMTSLFSLS